MGGGDGFYSLSGEEVRWGMYIDCMEIAGEYRQKGGNRRYQQESKQDMTACIRATKPTPSLPYLPYLAPPHRTRPLRPIN